MTTTTRHDDDDYDCCNSYNCCSYYSLLQLQPQQQRQKKALPFRRALNPKALNFQEGRQEVIDYIFHSQDLTLETPVVLPRMPEVGC